MALKVHTDDNKYKMNDYKCCRPKQLNTKDELAKLISYRL